MRSSGGQMARRLQTAIKRGTVPLKGSPIGGKFAPGKGSHGGVGANSQVNDPSLDHITAFDPAVVNTRPFEFSTQSETSMVANGSHIVVGYNSSAGAEVQFFPGAGLFFTKLLFSGYSVSHDGGATWSSGFVPPITPDVPFTFGDPSLALDRNGKVFYASLGTDATGEHNGIIINRSTNNGTSFAPATVVAVDDGSDKEWLAIGPDPAVPSRDNLYITWTSFLSDANGATIGSQLRLAKSTDGGATWSSKAIFTPVDDGANSSFVTFSNPVVDASSGRLYVPFLHFSDQNADNVRVMVSDDGGQTFRFLAFHVPGAVDAFAYPNVTPGALNDCGDGGIRNVLHQGPSAGAGRLGTFRFHAGDTSRDAAGGRRIPRTSADRAADVDESVLRRSDFRIGDQRALFGQRRIDLERSASHRAVDGGRSAACPSGDRARSARQSAVGRVLRAIGRRQTPNRRRDAARERKSSEARGRNAVSAPSHSISRRAISRSRRRPIRSGRRTTIGRLRAATTSANTCRLRLATTRTTRSRRGATTGIRGWGHPDRPRRESMRSPTCSRAVYEEVTNSARQGTTVKSWNGAQ